jgi:hypothetical protein
MEGRPMRTTCINITLVLLLYTICQSALDAQTVSPTPSASEMRELHTSFGALFQAMREGDVAVIEQYLSGHMSSEYKKLLEQNKDYPAFLRNFYKGATFSIASVTPTSDGGAVVDVVIQLGDGSKSITRLTAERSDGVPAIWKVARVTRDPRTEK